MENKIIRAAVYTRKSSEEGLEQCRVKRTSCATRHPQRPVSEFNSLDAQREACKAYIQSQKHEGWILVDKEYSDGGISGGTLNRPTIQELLEDIKTGNVNMIVVYNMLANRVYLGKLPYKNEEFEGNHEAIIPKQLFDKVQDSLKETTAVISSNPEPRISAF